MLTMRRVYRAMVLATVGLAGCREAPPVPQESTGEAAPAVMRVSQEQLLLVATKTAWVGEESRIVYFNRRLPLVEHLGYFPHNRHEEADSLEGH